MVGSMNIEEVMTKWGIQDADHLDQFLTEVEIFVAEEKDRNKKILRQLQKLDRITTEKMKLFGGNL
jgi:hypothetical protein